MVQLDEFISSELQIGPCLYKYAYVHEQRLLLYAQQLVFIPYASLIDVSDQPSIFECGVGPPLIIS